MKHKVFLNLEGLLLVLYSTGSTKKKKKGK